MGRFSGRIAIVTGAARGIGLATASRLTQEGASVAIFDIDADAAQAAADALPNHAATGYACDVTNTDSVDTAVAEVIARYGAVHILVNNAGVTRDNLLFKMTDDEWDLVISVHLRGAFTMSRAVQRHFVDQRYGKIVNLSSGSALGNVGQANYSAAKMGLQGFTRTLALELGRFNVNVNAVAPGFVATEMTDATASRLKMSVEEFRRMSAEANPIKRVGSPEDIAGAITFLASDEASYVTGQTLYVDGGGTL